MIYSTFIHTIQGNKQQSSTVLMGVHRATHHLHTTWSILHKLVYHKKVMALTEPCDTAKANSAGLLWQSSTTTFCFLVERGSVNHINNCPRMPQCSSSCNKNFLIKCAFEKSRNITPVCNLSYTAKSCTVKSSWASHDLFCRASLIYYDGLDERIGEVKIVFQLFATFIRIQDGSYLVYYNCSL